MNKINVRKCFSFGVSKDYPSGFVSISKENAEKLQNHGWKVRFHTDYYFNYIGAEFKDFQIGFGSWSDNLTAYIGNDEYQEVVKITNVEQMNKFVDMIESMVQFSNLNKN